MKIGITVFITILIALVIVSGCNNNDDPVRPPNNPPVIEELRVQNRTVEWGGTSRLWVTAEDPEGWDLTYSWTTTGGQFTSADTANSVMWQAPNESGSFAITITVSDGENSVSDSDTITVVANPVLLVSEEYLRFGTTVDTLSFNISNSRTGQLDWTLTTSTDDGGEWLNLLGEASGSTIGGESEEITLTVDRTGLSGGNYLGWVRISSNAGDDSVRVTMSMAEIEVSPASLDFGDEENTLSFNITNTGEGSLIWQAAENEEWMRISPESGTVVDNPAQVVVAVDRDGIIGGDFNRPINITSNGGNVSVNVHMSAEPLLTVDPLFLDFGNLNTQTFTITNDGVGILVWEVLEGEDWLTLSPDTGRTSPGDSQEIQLVADRTDLENGSYNSEALIVSNGGDDVVHLTLNVGPVIGLSRDTLSFDSTRSNMQFSVRNAGTGTMNWSISEDIDWLSLDIESGSSSGEADMVTATVDRENTEPGEYLDFITIDNGEGVTENLIVYMFIPEGITLLYDDGTAEFGHSQNSLFWYMVRFTKPDGWNATGVRAVRIFLETGGDQEFDISGVDDAEAVTDDDGNTQYIPPQAAPTAMLENVTQETGWFNYEVNRTFESEQFMVGMFFSGSPEIGVDNNSQVSLRATWRNVQGNTRQYITNVNWLIRIYVVEGDGQGSPGMWLDATGDAVPATGHSSKHGVSIHDIQDR